MPGTPSLSAGMYLAPGFAGLCRAWEHSVAPSRTGCPALAPAAPRLPVRGQGWVVPSAPPCGSGTPWPSGPVPPAPLSSGQDLPRSPLCSCRLPSGPAPFERGAGWRGADRLPANVLAATVAAKALCVPGPQREPRPHNQEGRNPITTRRIRWVFAPVLVDPGRPSCGARSCPGQGPSTGAEPPAQLQGPPLPRAPDPPKIPKTTEGLRLESVVRGFCSCFRRR